MSKITNITLFVGTLCSISTIFVGTSQAATPACTKIGTPARDVIIGTPANDVICGRAGNDTIYGGGGNDIIIGHSGNDVIHGGTGKDKAYGGDGKDKLYGNDNNDTLNGGYGGDTLKGGSGADILNGDAGTNNCLANEAKDREENASRCEKWVFLIPKSLSELAEPTRRIYPEEATSLGLDTSMFDFGFATFLHCLQNNCGDHESNYCIVLPNGYVDNCIVSDGYSGAWFDLSFSEFFLGSEESGWVEGTDLNDPTYPLGTRILDRKDGTSESIWAEPGSWVLEPAQVN